MLRYEYKYYVHNSRLNQLREMISSFVYLDPFANSRPQKEYTVRSIYFDTPDFECYTTKIDGIKHRNKVRLRGYNLEDPKNTVFMEIKKKYEAPIMKHRAPMLFSDSLRLFEGEQIEKCVQNTKKFHQAQDDARRFMYHVHARKMKPVVTVIYEREPYLSIYEDKSNNLRITFDKNLRSVGYPRVHDLYTEKQVQYALRDHFILEVKFNKYYPSWMKAVIGSLGLHKESASKYCLCIDAHPKINLARRFDTFAYGRFFDRKLTPML